MHSCKNGMHHTWPLTSLLLPHVRCASYHSCCAISGSSRSFSLCSAGNCFSSRAWGSWYCVHAHVTAASYLTPWLMLCVLGCPRDNRYR